MTKKDLQVLLATSKKKMDNYVVLGDKTLSMYELGRIESLELVLANLDSIVVNEHENDLIQRATEEAKFHIRTYFQNKYENDENWTTDDIETRIQRALDEGDDETLANFFIDSAVRTVSRMMTGAKLS